ncbi:Protease Do-like 2, chloroplastic, partial [Linum perenne]
GENQNNITSDKESEHQGKAKLASEKSAAAVAGEVAFRHPLTTLQSPLTDMSIALANSCCFPPAISSSSAAAAVSVSSRRLLSAAPFGCFASNQERNPSIQIEGVSQKKSPWTSVKHKPFGAQRKEKKKSLQFDLKVEDVVALLQNSAFLNSVVKVYTTHTEPDYSLPWQKQRPYTSTGSAFMIGDGKLLTNAHCVEHYTQVKVKRRGDDTKYVAKDSVTVVGYPLGGDTISVTKGVVSRIEVTSYAHGSSELLGIQIDAAINPGNSGGPAFNDDGECIGVAFQVYRSEEAENIGYVIPTMVVSHFLSDYERNQKYTGFPSLGVLLQKLENPALRECLKVPSTEGVLVRRTEPTADAKRVLKEGDVIVSFDNIRVGCEGTVPFRSNERIAFRYLISQKYDTLARGTVLWHYCPCVLLHQMILLYRFAGDIAELGIIRGGERMKVKVALNPRVHLVPYHLGQPSYLIIAGMVFTPLTEPLIEYVFASIVGTFDEIIHSFLLSFLLNQHSLVMVCSEECEDSLGVIETVNKGALLAGEIQRRTDCHPISASTGKYLVFEFEDSYMVVLEKEPSLLASSKVLRDYGIPSERSDDLLEPYDDSNVETNQLVANGDSGDCPVSNMEIEVDGMLWV